MRKNLIMTLMAGVALVAMTACALSQPAPSMSPSAAQRTSDATPQARRPVPVTLEAWRFRWDPHLQGLHEGWHGRLDDEDAWGPVKVPAYWSNTWIGDYQGFGWYRAHFDVPADCHDHALELTFGAVDEQAWVFINGQAIGEHSVASQGVGFALLWDKPFTLRVPAGHLRPGQRHLLAVLVHSAAGDGGIWLPIIARLTPPTASSANVNDAP